MTIDTLKKPTVVRSGTRPTRQEAEQAVRTLLAWTGDNPDREGLSDTPRRVVDSYEEFFSGYHINPAELLQHTFEDVAGYDDMVLLKNMRLESHCEHHMAPIVGRAHVAYFPNKRIVGISKLARLVDTFAKRLQTQEIMTAQIAQTIVDVLKPLGVAVLIDAKHHCMTTRGVHKAATTTITTQMTGVFKEDPRLRAEFMQLIAAPDHG